MLEALLISYIRLSPGIMKFSSRTREYFAFTIAVAAAFVTVSCGDGEDIIAPPPTGTLEVTTSTGGTELDPDGYSVQIDGGAAQALAVEATLTIAELAPGDHTVLLTGLAANCTISGANPLTVVVTAGETAPAAFAVTCAPTTGGLVITSTTTGPVPDADGYTISVDGTASHALGANEALTLEDLVPGIHEIGLDGLAENCSVAEGQSRAVTIVAGQVSQIQFDITCVSPTGSIVVATTTTGSSPDPDGYLLTLIGGESQAVGANATLRLEGLAVGGHVVQLSGQASNCRIDGENPRAVEVVAGTVTVTFVVTCLGADALIAYVSNAFELQAIFTVRPDGSDLRNLTPPGEFERDPVWSPDGRKILFGKDFDIYVMDADGTGRALLSQGLPETGSYTWSPDGRMIAFTQSGFVDDLFFQDLWIMRADGSDQRRLASGGASPSWSPDSRMVAYEGEGQIRVINADGTGDRSVTNQRFGASGPAWSPRGDRIAFVTAIDEPPDRPAEKHIFLINPDGTGSVNLTRGRGDDEGPVWSPDGSKIAFLFSEGEEGSEVAVMNSDGSGRTNLTRRSGFDLSPRWSPDGSRIVFHRSDLDDSEIHIMDADGSGRRNLSRSPDTEDYAPDWGGQGLQTVAARQSSAYKRWLRAQKRGETRLAE
jgi:Tol biopolymer transport system component